MQDPDNRYDNRNDTMDDITPKNDMSASISMTNACHHHDTSTDNCDLLSLLRSVEHLYASSRTVITSHAAAAILLSMTVEAQLLLTKLKAMRSRWTVHLPFKEANKVDFMDWSGRMAYMANQLRTADDRNCLTNNVQSLSSHCLIDLLEQATPDPDATFDLTDPKQLLIHRGKMEKQISANREQCIDAISQHVADQIKSHEAVTVSALSDLPAVRTACATLLSELSAELNYLHEQLVRIITPQEYERLANRILLEEEYKGSTARREAHDIMRNWFNSVPSGKYAESRMEQIKETKEKIRHTRHGVKLEQYVNLDADFSSQISEFGRFLFNRRKDITPKELYELIRLVYCVYFYQHDEQTQESVRTTNAPAHTDMPTILPLPADFAKELRESQVALMRFHRILRRVEPYINNNGTTIPGSTQKQINHYKDWTWYHLKTAFEDDQLHFLPKNSPKAGFAVFINDLFPHRSVTSVERSVYRNTNPNSPNIVADVVKEFSEVWK